MSTIAITSSPSSNMSSSSSSDPRSSNPNVRSMYQSSRSNYGYPTNFNQSSSCATSSSTPYGHIPSLPVTGTMEKSIMTTTNMMVPRKDSKNETILSGQFMVSEISEETDSGVQVGTDEADHEYNSDYGESASGTMNPAVISPISSDVKSMDLTTESNTFEYQGKSGVQSVTIDKSLSRLFHCMSLAYSGKLTSPKWKSFKGLRLKLKDKIRLNNIIWRAWHMQYIKGRDKPPFFQFATTYDVHNKPEAILLEGKYWKRGSGTVAAEYRKWRSFNHRTKSQSGNRFDGSHNENTKNGQNMTIEYYPSDGHGLTASASYDDDFMDFSDNTLFNTLCTSGGNDYLEFPNPREIARSGFGADCIQPGLTQLQPPMENYMDITFEPFQEFMSRTLSILPPLLEEPQAQTFDHSGQQSQQQQQQQQYNMYQQQQAQQQQTISFNQSNNNNYVQFTNESTNENGSASNNSNLMNTMQQQQQAPTLFPSSSVSSSATNSSSGQQQSSAGVSSGTVVNYKPINRNQSLMNSQQMSSLRHSPVEVYNAYQQPQNNSTLAPKQEPVQQGVPNNSTFAVPSVPLSSKMNRISTRSSRNTRDNTGSSNQSNVQDVQCVDTNVPTYQSQQQQQYNFSPSNQHFNPSAGSSSFSSVAGLINSVNNQLQSSQQFNEINQSNSLQERSITTQANNIIAQLLTSNTSNSSLMNQLNSPRHLLSNNNQNNTSFNGQVLNVRQYPPSPDHSRPTLSASSTSLPGIVGSSLATAAGTMSTRHAVRFDPGINQRSVAALRSEGMTSSVDDISFVGSSRSQSGAGGGPVRKISSPARICSPHPLASSGSRRTNRELSPSTLTLSHSASLGTLSTPHHHHPKLDRRHGSVSPGHSSSGGGHISPAHSGHERHQNREHRRVSHINAEQKRRCNIKNGFDTLRSILPSMSSSSASTQKVSKATMLNKAADYIHQLKSEQAQHKHLFERLRAETELLARQIREFQDQLPATGAPVSSMNRSGESRSQFELYVRERTRQNWKFWVFSLFVEPLFESFEANVSTRTIEDMNHSMMSWLDSSCSLMTLRRDVQDSLVHLSTSSSILTEPSRLPSEAMASVNERVTNNSTQSSH